MALEALTPRQPGQRMLPDGTVQRGQRAAAASSSRAGCTQGPRPRLRGPWALIFTVLGVLLLVKAASATSVWKDEIHQQSSAPLERSPQQKLCPPGFYMEEAIGGCAPCTDGIDYTNHSNTLPSCLPCTTCKSGEEEKNRCTPTKDSECQCKPGTFRGEDAPEFCQKCSTGCPDGKVMVMDCTPWSNIKCADQESSTLAHGEAPVPGELTTMSQRLPITPSPSSGSSRLVIKIASVITTVLIGCVWCYFTGLFNECWHKVIGFSSIWRHQTLSNYFRPATKPSVDTVPGLSYAVVPDSLNWPGGSRLNKKKLQKTTPSPEMQQADCLLKPAAPEGSQRRRWLLVPTDATERDLPDPGIEPTCPVSPSLQASSLPVEPSGKHYCFMPVQM
ncbi:tumor necrosis factor receptor superfamily member 10D-like isoform X3 [Bos indicus x Bos taurus]|uniref:tumor necrosis factor receptor superfamily member 10D-like isoform X3 n=1 Tax=Bos indicus x Bos taurus TaxID=30522 RepID=UPI000F7D0C1E|nr:tumor necrosis factor receptor superfamily member 10D-like isoform X3 [Bos indicus x Bos taurus]